MGEKSTTEPLATIEDSTQAAQHDVANQYPAGWKLVVVLLSLALGTLLMALDTTIISVAIPKISTEFKALNDVGWYGSGYPITLTAFQPVTGSAYRLFHPKFVYIVSIVVFEGTFHSCFIRRSLPTESY